MAVKYERYHLTDKAVKNHVDLLKKLKIPFILELSNYTAKITSDLYNIYFLKTEQSNQTFAAGAMLKAELKNVPPPDIDMNKNIYFNTNFNGIDFYADKVFNIDIKSAYASILYNEGYISLKLLRYLSKLPKQARLASVGMLASRKTKFIYTAGNDEPQKIEIVNPLSPFFYFAVQKTENIISDLRQNILKESYLFSWVDGIYFNNHNYVKVCERWLLEEYKLKSTFKELDTFEVKTKKDFYRITFNETESGKSKNFAVPLPETYFKKAMVNYLMKKKY